MTTSTRVGFIGLGAMGAAMARRLANARVPLHVYDTNPDRVLDLTRLGAVAASSPREVADVASIVFACLPGSDVSRTVAYGTDGVVHGKAIQVYAEMSTIGSRTVRDIEKHLSKRGIAVVDAPVSGGPKGADAGTLSVMLAGPLQAREALLPLLKIIAGHVFQVGEEPGKAQVMKLVNNLISAANMASAFEALVLGAKAGLDADMMVEVINASTGRNSATTDKVPKSVLPRSFDYGAAIRTIHKDVTLGLDEAEDLGVPMWVGRNIRQVWEHAMTQGGAEEDFTALIRYMEAWAKTEVRGRAAKK